MKMSYLATSKKDTAETDPASTVWWSFNSNDNVTGVGGDLTLAAGDGIRNIDLSGVRCGNEDFFGQKAAAYVAGIRFDIQFAGIAAVEVNVTCGSFNLNLVSGSHILQIDLAGVSHTRQIPTLNVGQNNLSCGDTDRKVVST